MGRNLLDLDEGLMVHLYVDEKWGTERIAKKFGCSARAIGKRLDKLGVLDRTRVYAKARGKEELAISLRVDEKKSLSEISRITGLSKSTLSTLLKDYPLGQADIGQKDRVEQALVKAGEKSHEAALARKAAMTKGVSPIPEKIPSYKKGLIGEAFVKYQFLRHGLEILEPSVLEPGCDLVVRNGGRYFRCEIKSSTTDTVGIRHTKFISGGGYETLSYLEENEIDFFICVLLSKEQLFIIPFSEAPKSGVISLGGFGRYMKYLDAYDLFTEDVV